MVEDATLIERKAPNLMEKAGRHALIFAFITVFLDAAGIGLIFPVLPSLIQELKGLSVAQAAVYGGYLAFSYSLMQFLCGPLLGNISDRFGRRPVLLVSLAVLGCDYIIMTLTQDYWILFIGRIVAGVSGATYATVNAFIADVSPPDKRAANFGIIGAGFGAGFIFGPMIGGWTGAEFGTRAPFFVAAVLAFLNFSYGYFVFPESLPKEKRRKFEWRRANPVGALARISAMPVVGLLVFSYFAYYIAHLVYPAVWAYYTEEAFNWTPRETGYSLTAVGIVFLIVQGYLIRKIIPAIGEVRTVYLGVLLNILGLVGTAFAPAGWFIYLMIPLAGFGAIVRPALTAVISNQVSESEQGELQGILAGAAGIAAIICPLVMTQSFTALTREGAAVYFPGIPFLLAALMLVVAIIPFYRTVGTGIRKNAPAE